MVTRFRGVVGLHQRRLDLRRRCRRFCRSIDARHRPSHAIRQRGPHVARRTPRSHLSSRHAHPRSSFSSSARINNSRELEKVIQRLYTAPPRHVEFFLDANKALFEVAISPRLGSDFADGVTSLRAIRSIRTGEIAARTTRSQRTTSRFPAHRRTMKPGAGVA